ncbi:MAG: flippase, partial [Rivularia sp. ALOHA_DT_140]|nr:flippase [Rivularia sp. ALOHA_DT_140]
MAFGLVVGVWVARYLGPQQFGLYNYGIAFAALFGPIATLGLDQIVVREIVRNPESKNEIIGTTFVLKFFAGLLTIFFTLGVIYLLRPNDTMSIGIVGIISAKYVFQAFDIIDFWFQSQVKSKYTVWAKNTAFVVSSILKIILIQIQASLITFVWLILIEAILAAIGLLISYQYSQYGFKNWRLNFHRAKLLLKDSYPLILSSFAIVIYMKVDQIMLGEMVGDKAVGIYSASVKISEIFYFIPVAISSSVTPAILKAREISQQKFYSQLQKT